MAKKTKTSKAKSQPPTKEYGYVSKSQATLALKELESFLLRSKEESEKSNLLDDDGTEYTEDSDLIAEIKFKKYYKDRPRFKPEFIQLTKPFLKNVTDLKICLFVRNDLFTTEAELAVVENCDVKLEKIITLDQLKTEYNQYYQRKQLYADYDLFLVDHMILSSMPTVLGKTFYDNDPTKFPISLKVAATKQPNAFSPVTFKNQFEKIIGSAPYLPAMGQTLQIRFGSLNNTFSTDDLLLNLSDLLKTFEEEKLITVGIRTRKSPVLPLFYATKIYGDDDVAQDDDEESENEEEDPFMKGLMELANDEEVKNKVAKLMARRKKVLSGRVSK